MTKLHNLVDCDLMGHQILTELLQAAFLDGMCYEFAIAAHNMTGWPMAGILHEDVFRHVFLKPFGRKNYFDARGFITPAQLPKPFRDLPRAQSLNILPIKPGEVADLRKIDKESVRFASILFENVWPELVRKGGHNKNVQSFFAGLEKLCKKHRLWIRGPFPNARPRICTAIGNETGFEVHPIATGSMWSFSPLPHQTCVAP